MSNNHFKKMLQYLSALKLGVFRENGWSPEFQNARRDLRFLSGFGADE